MVVSPALVDGKGLVVVVVVGTLVVAVVVVEEEEIQLVLFEFTARDFSTNESVVYKILKKDTFL